MRKIFGMLIGMIGGITTWQAIMAFIGSGLFVSGTYAGFSLLAFAFTLFIIGGFMLTPKEKNG